MFIGKCGKEEEPRGNGQVGKNQLRRRTLHFVGTRSARSQHKHPRSRNAEMALMNLRPMANRIPE